MRTLLKRLHQLFVIGVWLLPSIGFAQSQDTAINSNRQNESRGQILRGQPILLFDGATLQGWTMGNGKPSSNWVVQDGLLYRASNGGDLYHQHWYRDFELSFNWKIAKGGNSGIKYRVQKYGKQNLGCEYQLQDDQGRPSTKNSSGSIYDLYPPSPNATLNPLGEWNQSRIVVCGHRIEHWLNGQIVVSATSGSDDWLRRVANSKFKEHDFFGQNRDGQIFLQDHGNPIWFQAIELVPLDCDCQLPSYQFQIWTARNHFENSESGFMVRDQPRN